MSDNPKMVKVKAAYAQNLRASHAADNSGKYAWPITKLDEVVDATFAAIANGGIGAVNIKTGSWKATAKQFGIKNTPTEWRGLLGCA